jgi:hypothetical protein
MSYPINLIQFFTQTTYSMHEFLAYIICNVLEIIMNEEVSIVAYTVLKFCTCRVKL